VTRAQNGAAGWDQQHGGSEEGPTRSRSHPLPHSKVHLSYCQRDSQSAGSEAPVSELRLELDVFLADLKSSQRRETTRRFYQQKLTPFLSYLAECEITTVVALTSAAIRGYILALAETHTPGGCHAYWRAIRAFTRFLLREGVLERDPMVALRAPRVDQEPLEPVSLADVQAMVATCRRSDRDLRDASIWSASWTLAYGPAKPWPSTSAIWM